MEVCYGTLHLRLLYHVPTADFDLKCKRLKLKCDRRTPCDQCVKRSSESKCIYSQQAAEKV